MAKDILERLLEQAARFHQWQESAYPGKSTEEFCGEWEFDYPGWNDTYDAFCHVLTQMDARTADDVLLDEMACFIARDNEAEGLVKEVVQYGGSRLGQGNGLHRIKRVHHPPPAAVHRHEK